MAHVRGQSSFALKLEHAAAALEQARTTGARIISWRFRRARANLHERLETIEDRLHAARGRGPIKVPLWLAAALVIVAALVTQVLTLTGLEERHAVETRQLKQIYISEKAAAEERARQTLAQAVASAQRLAGTSIAWTIRSALARHSYDELEQYVNELATHERVKLVLLADRSGKVVAASEPGFKGTDFSRHFPNSLLEDATMSIHSAEGERKRLVIPIVRFSARLGTAVLVYDGASPPSR